MVRSNQLSEPDETLFCLKSEFRIVGLNEDDALLRSDALRDLRDLVVSTGDMYPSIERWFDEKVVPGLKRAERFAFVAYEGENPVASAVLKRGERSKFCHVRVKEDFQDRDLGQMFFTLMTLQVLHHAKEIHFTLPESLWCRRGRFFQSFGFSSVDAAQRQYRRGNEELVCSAPISSVWSALVEKIPRLAGKFSVPGWSLAAGLLMSVRPKYVDRIFAGEKQIEIRKSFSEKWVGSKVALYASRPTKALVGQATVGSAISGHPDNIWAEFHDRAGCSREEFESYVGSVGRVWAIELVDVAPYTCRATLSQISELLQQDLRPPQSYCSVSGGKNGAWSSAISLAGLLHAGLGRPRRGR